MAHAALALAQATLAGDKDNLATLARISAANRMFDLGVDPKTLALVERFPDTRTYLEEAYFLGFFHFSQLVQDISDAGGTSGGVLDHAAARDLRLLGWGEVADILEDYFDLVVETPLADARPADEDPTIARSPAVEAHLTALRDRWARQARRRTPNRNDLTLAERLGVTFLPEDEVEPYWIERIIAAPGFQDTAAAQKRVGADWSADLTDKIVSILSARGYHLEFVFWRRQVGLSRGYVYAQTAKGPIRIFDETDAVSLRTYFPVEVQSPEGDPLFTIQAEDDPGAAKARGVVSMLRQIAGLPP